jgi:hypothetical protein
LMSSRRYQARCHRGPRADMGLPPRRHQPGTREPRQRRAAPRGDLHLEAWLIAFRPGSATPQLFISEVLQRFAAALTRRVPFRPIGIGPHMCTTARSWMARPSSGKIFFNNLWTRNTKERLKHWGSRRKCHWVEQLTCLGALECSRLLPAQ